MKITVLGSGSFFIDKDHSAPAYLIEYKGMNILLDCGPGTLVQLGKLDFDPLKLDYIFLTHFHNDHTSDIVALLFRGYLLENFYGGKVEKKVKLIAPKGVKNFIADLANIFNHKGLPTYEKVEYVEFEPKMEFGDFKLETFNVEHLGLDAFALRFDFNGKLFAYSGDSGYCEGVVNAAKDADLFITDCAVPKGTSAAAHLNSTEVGEICRDNNVKKVILSHQVPRTYVVDMVAEVKEVFDGEVVLAKDLMEIKL